MRNHVPLRGCAPEPLIHYLKALGILRLVAEQFDPQVRAAWHGDTFVLETTKSEDELIDFFLNHYRPTPIVAPWNGGSGFYDGDDTSGIDGILSFESERLDDYKEAIESVFAFPELPSVSHLTSQDLIKRVQQQIDDTPNKESKDVKDWFRVIDETNDCLSDLGNKIDLQTKTIPAIEEIKASATDKNIAKQISNLLQPVKKLRTIIKKSERSAGKDTIIQACRNRLSDKCVEWLDATVVLSEKDAESPLLGSGGNDGRLDFTKAFMLYLKEALSTKEGVDEKWLAHARKQLRSALFADSVATAKKEIVGQFYPAGAGGVNATQGVSDSPMVNPWDFILGMEGTLVLASATVRQLAAGMRTKASFPFTVKSSKVGYGTAADAEDVKAELWLPLWSRMSPYKEVSHIFKEGRVQFSHQKRIVKSGFDFARAVAELGVDRGISSFQRYVFTRRFGKNYFAVPLSIFEVKERPLASLVQQVDRWLDALARATSDEKKTPPRFVRARKRIEEAIFKLCARGDVEDLRETFVALGAAEAELANGEKFRSGDEKKKPLLPLTGLSLRWLWECDDQTPEFSIAAALAAIGGEGKVGALRSNVEPFDQTTRQWAKNSNSFVWSAAALEINLAAVLQRRSIDSRMHSLSHPPLGSNHFASLEAVAAFLNRETDDERIEEFLRALILLDKFTPAKEPCYVPPGLPRAYALLKLLYLPKGELQLKEGSDSIIIKHEPAIVPLLRAGRVADALNVADQRLKASGLVPLTKDFFFPPEDGMRLAAALLIPIDEPSIRELAQLVLHEHKED